MSTKTVFLSFVLVLFLVGFAGAQECPEGDLNEDCKVDSRDLRILAGSWLDMDCLSPDCEADLDGVRGVDMSDFALLAGTWYEDYSEITLVINEFMAANNSDSGIRDEWGDYDDWIEIYNYGHEAIDIGGMYIIDDISKPAYERWMIPTNNPEATLIPAGGYLVLWADSEPAEGTLHIDFKLSASDTDEDICLFESDRITIIDAVYNFNVPVPQQQNKSYGRYPDGSDNWLVFDNPTPGKPNVLGGLGILISEIMYHPYHSVIDPIEPEDIRQEYIEIYNNGDYDVSLVGWRFSNGVDFAFPDARTLYRGQYLVVAADVNAFKAKYPTVTNVVGGWDGHLSNSGEAVELIDEMGNRIDHLHYSDEGDWAVRELGPVDYFHRGWNWNYEHDGGGKAMGLRTMNWPNEHGQNWAAR